jgi:hypothetical protein
MFLIHIFKILLPIFCLSTFNNSVLAFSSEKWREILKSGTCAGAGDFCVAWEAHGGGAGRTLINSIDPGTAFRVSFPLSGAQQERRDLFRSPSVQA